jgi:hypothetical protein
MRIFIESNPGLKSRFPRTIAFPDYSNDELVTIFRGFVGQAGLSLGDGVLPKVLEALGDAPRDEGFGNGRLARDLFQHMLGRQAVRLGDHDPSDEELCTLTVQDFGWVPPRPEKVATMGFRLPSDGR